MQSECVGRVYYDEEWHTSQNEQSVVAAVDTVPVPAH